ncbi:aromatic amino acid ammonia-lyase [Leifsonia aquatica]|uniref:Histidine ammonia-lyase n=2 Tax=Leifsonia aquatica TaxID=144185 RepID=A0A7W4UW26_LEIAQ|nr:aromatic amino acid ammonia-lyase [Leifsonia aquatica]MBB2967137.1 histidine ammonia-lyase [Leifsonia aquatica]
MAAAAPIRLGAAAPRPEDIAAVADGAVVELTPEARETLAASRAVVEHAIASGEPVYGLNRRLGAGRDDAVDPEEFAAFQRRTIANHRGGVGDPLSEPEARAVVVARLAGFTRGGAGVRPVLAQAYADILNAGVVPFIPSRGSVGAADLTALAEVVAVVTGDGAVIDGSVSGGPAREALAAAGLEPLDPAPHEALAALSSNAYSIGVGSLALLDAEALTAVADHAVALSLEAAAAAGPAGNPSPYTAIVAEARGGRGQIDSAAAIRAALDGSVLHDPARPVTVQDPLAFRSAPQLHGALREAVERVRTELELELAARSENPVVDIASGRLVSGGNFQALPLALAFEGLRLAIAHVAAASERRTAAHSVALAPARADGRTRVPGLLLYSAASAAAELKQLAVPATLGSTTLSGVEDHSSFAPLALRLAQRSLALAAEVFAAEALHAVELLHANGALPAGSVTGPLAMRLEEVIEAGAPARTLVEQAAAELRAQPAATSLRNPR